MSDLTTIARPYAKAAFDFAVKEQAVDKWAEMLFFCAEIAKNDRFSDLLNGAVSSHVIADIFIKIADEQLNEQGQNFIKLLAENGRLSVLPNIVTLFAHYKAEHEKTAQVDVTSATALSAEQEANIIARLEKRLARKVKLNCNVDDTLIGGLIIQAGDLVIDGSVRGKLTKLADALQS
jgi:F-type H+-transporting ATPase subunit delta